MAPDSGNAAQRLSENETPEEPSMEEILSSIKQIIADDQTEASAPSTRDEFTYPDNPSNSNATTLPAEEVELQAKLEAGLQESLAQTAGQQPGTNATNSEATKRPSAAAIHNQVSATSSGMTAEERIRQYRERNKLRIEALADEKTDKKSAPAAPVQQAKAAPVAPPVAPPLPKAAPPVASAPQPKAPPAARQPSEEEIAKEMAAILMNDRSVEIEHMLKDIMRPTIRQWLNDNLPSMVQRLVREEIQAASRGRKTS